MSILHHPRKANVVAEALSRMSMGSIAHVEDSKNELAQEVHQLARLGVLLVDTEEGDIWVQSSSESSLVSKVKEKKDRDPILVKLNESVKDQKEKVFSQDSQAKRTIQTLEDMLRACAIGFRGSWDDHLPLIEFAYNNNYYSSIHMAPFEALYGRRCRSPIGWFKVSEALVIWPDLISPMKEVKRFGKKGKHSPRYVGPFKVLNRFCKVAYGLKLPSDLASVHPVFHVYLFKKCIGDLTVIVPIQSIDIQNSLSYEENPSDEGATWEVEADMRSKYPHLFSSNSDQAQVMSVMRSCFRFKDMSSRASVDSRYQQSELASVAAKNERPVVVPSNSVIARIQDFTRMNPPFFLGSKTDEDPQEFLNQGNMTVKEYSLKLTQLGRYSPHVVVDSRARMTPSSANAPVPKFREGSKDRAPDSKSQGSVSGARTYSLCKTYEKHHQGIYRAGSGICFRCGKPGHRVRDYTHPGNFEISPEILAKPFSVSTPVGKIIIAQQSDPYEKSFQELKTRLTSAPVLAFVDGSDGFVVYYDSSRVGLGYVLIQYGKANIVVDALSRLSMGSVAHVEDSRKELAQEFHQLVRLGVRLVNTEEGDIWVQTSLELSLVSKFSIPTWNWEEVNIDFVMGLPRTRHQHDSVWVIVDRMTKSAYFFPVHTSYSAEDYAKLYIRELVRLHGFPLFIILDRDGQAEKTIQTLEDMLRVCAIDFKGSWDHHLPLIEFVYNNNYYSSIHMAPFKALYAYELELPSDLASVYAVFYVSFLKKCIGDPTVVVPIQSIDIQNSLSYEEIPFIKGATWEAEVDMRSKYPYLFSANSDQAQGRRYLGSKPFSWSTYDGQNDGSSPKRWTIAQAMYHRTSHRRFRDMSSRASVDSRYQQSELAVQISVMGYLVVVWGRKHHVAFRVPDSGRYTLLMSLRTLNMFCNETPKALYNYREDKLLYLRGTRTRKLWEWDRVYDYDVYNDFGNADSSPLLAQPFLGGYKEYLYLRRGRTGRPPSKTALMAARPIEDDRNFYKSCRASSGYASDYHRWDSRTSIDISGKPYMSWVLDAEIHLDVMGVVDIIKNENQASNQDRAKAMIFLRHHLDEGLKMEYLTIKDPRILRERNHNPIRGHGRVRDRGRGRYFNQSDRLALNNDPQHQ
ncbi:hypothetical protein FXO38_32476 [Capsicum annuum]|nr:hypothetical protein FXO38_32476 [Capsicum annuum]